MSDPQIDGTYNELVKIFGKSGTGGMDAAIAASDPHSPEVSADDKKCRSKGVTNAGISKFMGLQALVAGIYALYNAYNSYKIAKLQKDMADRYYKLAEKQRNYYNDRYKPLEEELGKEALKLPKYARDKDRFYAGQMLVSARGKTAGQLDKLLSCTGRYCTGKRAKILTDVLLSQATTDSLVAGMAHRYADKEETAFNNLRWEKRDQVLRIGRDIPTEAVSYANLAMGTLGSLGEQAGKAAEGAMMFLGYDRAGTRYPPRRGPLQVSEYKYQWTQLEEFSPKPREVYVKPDEPETIVKISG